MANTNCLLAEKFVIFTFWGSSFSVAGVEPLSSPAVSWAFRAVHPLNRIPKYLPDHPYTLIAPPDYL